MKRQPFAVVICTSDPPSPTEPLLTPWLAHRREFTRPGAPASRFHPQPIRIPTKYPICSRLGAVFEYVQGIALRPHWAATLRSGRREISDLVAYAPLICGAESRNDVGRRGIAPPGPAHVREMPRIVARGGQFEPLHDRCASSTFPFEAGGATERPGGCSCGGRGPKVEFDSEVSCQWRWCSCAPLLSSGLPR